jgi:hypothetical protein
MKFFNLEPNDLIVMLCFVLSVLLLANNVGMLK